MGTATLRHDAFLYETENGFADRVVPFVTDGLDEGDAVVAVVTRSNWDVLREALGAGSELVSFVDRDTWYLRPATTIAGYDRTLTRLTRAGAPRVRAIGEVAFGTTPDQWAEWTVYEAILNRALARHPAWVVCPYDARVLPDRVLKDAVHTHDAGDDHDALVRSHALPFEPLPELRTVMLGAGARGLREQLARELVAARVPDAQARDLILAAGELLANARRHGEGPFTLRAGRVHGRFVCELSDRGAGLDDPYAGYLPPHAGGGAGLWVARQLVWRLELASGPGLTARLWL